MRYLIGLTATLLLGIALGVQYAEVRASRHRRSPYELRHRLSLLN